MNTIVLLGFGNVGFHLINTLNKVDKNAVIQIYNRTTVSLNSELNHIPFTTDVSKIKDADLYIIAPKASGKSTAIVMGVIQQLKAPFEEAPRAIIMVATKEKAFELEEQFEILGKHTELRTFTVFDQGVIQYQKDMIFEGLDGAFCCIDSMIVWFNQLPSNIF